MNISNIEKVANRKRINDEAEKLREKVSRETANIIKLKVAQDAAYWDVKEKLHQLENNHERLQQNMVEVQMQHESLSGRYQDELRLRPETLNKLSSTREICDVLEEYTGRLKATVSRCQADQATLAAAYNQSGQVVRDIKTKQLQAEETSRQLAADLREKVKIVTEHKEQMAQMFSSTKQRLESDINDARTKLAAVLGQKDELFIALNDFSRKLDQSKRELEKKDENIANLQTDVKKLIYELNNQGVEMKNMAAKHEKDLKEHSESNETLQKALNNQEQFTRSVCDQNNQLQEKISALEEEQISGLEKVKDLEQKLEEAKALCDQLTNERATLSDKKEELEMDIDAKIMLLKQSEIEGVNLRAQMSALEAQIAQGAAELETTIQESTSRFNKNEELAAVVRGLEADITGMENVVDTLKAENIVKINDINATLDSKIKIIEVKDKELDCKASTINQLMSDLKNVSDAKTKLESNLEKLKKNMEVERENAKEKEVALGKKIEKLENAVKDKENELSRQMTVILDIRNDKERLQQRLKSVESTIDNIQKEVTGRSATALPPRQAAELDDNAVMMTPTPQKKVGIHAPKVSIPPTMELAKEQANQDSLLFPLFSDSSMDNELTIDDDEVNRRFDAFARGERIPPLTFKRRKGPSSSLLGGLKPLADGNKPVSLSQARDIAVKSKRAFFKNKRSDNKAKKFKPDD